MKEGLNRLRPARSFYVSNIRIAIINPFDIFDQILDIWAVIPLANSPSS